jgi:proteasome lid subunit RPN8/RPN11
MKCAISRGLSERLRSEAQAAGKKEICGLLLGSERRIEQAVAIPNVAADPERAFLLDPAAHLGAARAAREAGLDVIGAYHSHPSADARPSESDSAQAGEQGRYWLILTAEEQALWRSRAGGALLSAFDPVPLEIA